MKTLVQCTFILAGLLSAFSASAQVSQTRSWAAACANCHGTTGNAQTGMPSLAGRPDIARFMQEFKNGKRVGTLMPQLAKGYSDEQISQIAAYFAAQTPAADK